MNFIEIFLEFLDAKFRPILLLTSTGFGLYFAIKKIGQKVSAQYSFGGVGFAPVHIREVVFSNKKDKPVNIYAVYAVFKDGLWLELERCTPPRILKPYESMALTMKPYSKLRVDNAEYKPEFSNATIYIESDDIFIKCESMYRPQLSNNHKKISIYRYSYNDFIYDKTVAFILVYVLDKSLKTAFITKTGYIGNEWDFSPNHLRGAATEVNIKSMIHSHGFDSAFSSYVLYRVDALGKPKIISK